MSPASPRAFGFSGATLALVSADLQQRLAWLTGPACTRGYLWAVSVRVRRPGGDWPAWEASARVRELARAKVADLAGDDLELLELLAQECVRAAAREWAAPAPRAGTVG